MSILLAQPGLSAGVLPAETPMPSTSLRDIAYDPDARTLDVTFISSGKRYRYFDVAFEEYDALRRAFSKGAHFNIHIKPLHEFAPLVDPEARRRA
jgi:hypothetical protein